MTGLLVLVINLAIVILVLGLCYAILTWALGLAGISVPARAIQIVFAIIVLIVLLSLVTGYVPPLRWR